MSRKPLLGSTDISEGFLVLSQCNSYDATKWCTSRVDRCSAATWDLWSSRGLLPRRRRFSGSRPTEHRALYRMVRVLHLAGERSTGSTPRQHQLGDADSRVLPIALFSVFSIRGFPVSSRSHLVCGLGSATMSHGSTGMLVKCWVRSW